MPHKREPLKKKKESWYKIPKSPPYPPTHLSFASPHSHSFFLIVPSVPLSSEHSDTETQKIQLLCQQISKLGPSQGHIITQNRAFTWNSPSILDHHTAEPAGYIPCFLTTLNLKKCVAINWQNQSMLYEHFWPPLQKKGPFSLSSISRGESGPLSVQCCYTSTETLRFIRFGEPRTATSTFAQLLSSESDPQQEEKRRRKLYWPWPWPP